MPEHEPVDIASKDNERAEKPEARAARREATTRGGLDMPNAGSANVARLPICKRPSRQLPDNESLWKLPKLVATSRKQQRFAMAV